jgi:hypothetical protein
VAQRAHGGVITQLGAGLDVMKTDAILSQIRFYEAGTKAREILSFMNPVGFPVPTQ